MLLLSIPFQNLSTRMCATYNLVCLAVCICEHLVGLAARISDYSVSRFLNNLRERLKRTAVFVNGDSDCYNAFRDGVQSRSRSRSYSSAIVIG